MKFLIKQFSQFTGLHIADIVKSPVENAFCESVPVEEMVFPNLSFVPAPGQYDVTRWEEWVKKGFDHKQIPSKYPDREIGFYRQVMKDRWFVEIDTLDDLLYLLRKYKYQLIITDDEEYILT